MEYVDLINEWQGERQTMEAYLGEHESDLCHVEIDDDTRKSSAVWPVLRRMTDCGEMTALLHVEGVLRTYPQVEGHWDGDPDVAVLRDDFGI